MIIGVNLYFHQQTINPESYSEKYAKLLRCQNKIGWFNLLKGRFSKEWSIIQHNHEGTQQPTGWLTKVIRYIWKETHQL